MKCVLFLISLVLVVNVDALVNLKLGCFSNSPKIYPSSAKSFRSSGEFSHEKCTNICFSWGKKYAAVHRDGSYGVCACFDKLQHETRTSCDTSDKVGVFQTYFSGGSIGCYKYNGDIYTPEYFGSKNSPSYCIAECKKAGYKYAGLLWYTCACSNTIFQSELSVGECTRRCSGAPGIFCGGTLGQLKYLTVFQVQ